MCCAPVDVIALSQAKSIFFFVLFFFIFFIGSCISFRSFARCTRTDETDVKRFETISSGEVLLFLLLSPSPILYETIKKSGNSDNSSIDWFAFYKSFQSRREGWGGFIEKKISHVFKSTWEYECLPFHISSVAHNRSSIKFCVRMSFNVCCVQNLPTICMRMKKCVCVCV